MAFLRRSQEHLSICKIDSIGVRYLQLMKGSNCTRLRKIRKSLILQSTHA